MKQKIDIFVLLFGVALFLSGCSKTDIPTPTVSTVDVTSITEMTAIAGGIISTDNGSTISARGVCWNELPNPTTSDNKTLDGVGKGSFTSTMTELKPFTTYYVRAYISNSEGTIYGNEISFITLAEVPKACFEIASIVGFKAIFSNCSDYPTTCLWDFGDGNTSTENAPTHNYIIPGTFNVKLVVSNDGMSDSIIKSVVISDIVDLNNMVVPPGWDGNSAKIDVDCDGKYDFEIIMYLYGGFNSGRGYKTYIGSSNNYELLSDSLISTVYDNSNFTQSQGTFFIPKVLILGDSITTSAPTKKGLMYINADWQMYHGISYAFDTWTKNEIRYIGYRKTIGTITKIGWIKLKVFGNMTLFSYKMPTEAKFLIIDK